MYKTDRVAVEWRPVLVAALIHALCFRFSLSQANEPTRLSSDLEVAGVRRWSGGSIEGGGGGGGADPVGTHF